ncbi:hypothetical protein NLI96_g381 [Meripilus lineatus]|uniref:Uncharacterized protein n=1 Tax=Meripilus lineatus TaxID=2056292 RepID=A0AAD5VCU1_9APHY|nr:hypothetical protein NLI96_g381 [Physisporinus lineatus]
MKTFAAISLLVSVALVQAKPLIPTGISTGCSDFLTTLNKDTSFSSFTTPLVAATSQFVGNTTTPSAATLKASLTTLCNINAPVSALRSKLGNFYSACQAELTTTPNQDVIAIYDVVYIAAPLQQAVCSKTDSGDFCVGQIDTKVDPVDLYTSDASSGQVVLTPNTQTFLNNNIAFLLYTKDTPKATLCTPCVRSALTSFVSWESSTPYAPGLKQSTILANQPDFYTHVQDTCGSSFMQGAVQAAGELSGGILSGAPRTVSAATGGISIVLGAITAAMVATL